MQTQTNTLLQVEKIFQTAKENSISDVTVEKAKSELIQFSEFLSVTDQQALITACIMGLNYQEGSVSIKDICRTFDCNPISFLKYSSDINYLIERKIILKKYKFRHYDELELGDCEFMINKEISSSIINNTTLIKNKNECDDLVEVLSEIYDLVKDRSDDKILTRELYREAEGIMDSGRKFKIFNKIEILDLSLSDAIIFFTVCWKTLSDTSRIYLNEILEQVFDSSVQAIRVSQLFQTKQHSLLNKDLLELDGGDYSNDVEVKLSEKAIGFLKEDGIEISLKGKTNCKDLILPENIKTRNLFYNNSEKSQIELI